MRSSIAFAIVASLNTLSQLEKLIFVVIIVERFSYRLSISWKNILESSASIGSYPSSLIIKHLYLVKCFILASSLFSNLAFLS